MSQPAGPFRGRSPPGRRGGLSAVCQCMPSDEASITSSDPFARQPKDRKPLACGREAVDGAGRLPVGREALEHRFVVDLAKDPATDRAIDLKPAIESSLFRRRVGDVCRLTLVEAANGAFGRRAFQQRDPDAQPDPLTDIRAGGETLGIGAGSTVMVRASRGLGVGRGLGLAGSADWTGVAVASLVSFTCSGISRLAAISRPPTSASTARPTISRSPAVLGGRRPSDVERGTWSGSNTDACSVAGWRILRRGIRREVAPHLSGSAATVRPMDSPDLIIFGARLEPVAGPWLGSSADALAISGGRIAAVGTAAEVRALAGSATRVVRSRGRRWCPASSTRTCTRSTAA